MTSIPYSMTADNIAVIYNGKAFNVAKGSPHFQNLRNALLDERWEDVPEHLTVESSLSKWARGEFTLNDDDTINYRGEKIPAAMDTRIQQLASAGDSPEPVFRFWERLSRNPSNRSVEQLWSFLNHSGIPLTEDGCFLAYKSVRSDFLDHHSGTVSNTVGTVNKMPRNKISDDPRKACHYGFHVGALDYAASFGTDDRIIVICKVDPENVVCVPYDSSAMKMRVCEYEVTGIYEGKLPDTIWRPESDNMVDETYDYDSDEEDDEDEGEEWDDDAPADAQNASQSDDQEAPATSGHPFDTADAEELLRGTIRALRHYATHVAKVVGASKIAGGKVPLVSAILDARMLAKN